MSRKVWVMKRGMPVANHIVGKIGKRTYVVRMLSGIGRWLQSAWRKAIASVTPPQPEIGRFSPTKLKLVRSKPFDDRRAQRYQLLSEAFTNLHESGIAPELRRSADAQESRDFIRRLLRSL